VPPMPASRGARGHSLPQRRAARDFFQPVLVVLGTPSWAARAPSDAKGRTAARPREPPRISIAAYRAFVRELLALGAREGVALDWWSPGMSPTTRAFWRLSGTLPCGAVRASARVAVAAYAELARAMAASWPRGRARHLLLGRPQRIRRRCARLDVSRTLSRRSAARCPVPERLLAIHAYAARGRYAAGADPVKTLETALEARGGCNGGARTWVTEAGAGRRTRGGRALSARRRAAGCAPWPASSPAGRPTLASTQSCSTPSERIRPFPSGSQTPGCGASTPPTGWAWLVTRQPRRRAHDSALGLQRARIWAAAGL